MEEPRPTRRPLPRPDGSVRLWVIVGAGVVLVAALVVIVLVT